MSNEELMFYPLLGGKRHRWSAHDQQRPQYILTSYWTLAFLWNDCISKIQIAPVKFSRYFQKYSKKWCASIIFVNVNFFICNTSITRPRLNAYNRSAALDPWIPLWSATSPKYHLSFSKPCSFSVHKTISIPYSYHPRCQGSINCPKSDVRHLLALSWYTG